MLLIWSQLPPLRAEGNAMLIVEPLTKPTEENIFGGYNSVDNRRQGTQWHNERLFILVTWENALL